MLTDEQAFYIRACEEFDILVRASTQAKWKELEDLGFVQDNPGDSKPNNWRLPTDTGRAALAEYRAAHVTVRREDLREIRRRCANIKYTVSIQSALEALEKGEPLPPEGEE